MLERLAMRLVLLSPAARAVRLGLQDGQDGMTPQLDGYYYRHAYAIGRAKFLNEPPPKPWTPKHARH